METLFGARAGEFCQPERRDDSGEFFSARKLHIRVECGRFSSRSRLRRDDRECANRFTNTNTKCDSDCHADADSNSCTDIDSNALSNSNRDANSDTFRNSNGNAFTDTNAHTDRNTNIFTDSNALADLHSDFHTNSDAWCPTDNQRFSFAEQRCRRK